MKHRLLTAVCALLLMGCSLTGCGASNSTDDIAEEQLPYGATISSDSSRSMTFSYDKRFLDDALVDKLYTYYHAIETKDGEAFGSVLFPLYHDYQLTALYENTLTDQDIIDRTYDSIKEYFGYDFAYTFVDVTNLASQIGESSSRDALAVMLDQLAEDQDMKAISDDTQKLYELTVTRYVDKKDSGNKKETEDSLVGETLFAIQYQNEWYLMYS